MRAQFTRVSDEADEAGNRRQLSDQRLGGGERRERPRRSARAGARRGLAVEAGAQVVDCRARPGHGEADVVGELVDDAVGRARVKGRGERVPRRGGRPDGLRTWRCSHACFVGAPPRLHRVRDVLANLLGGAAIDARHQQLVVAGVLMADRRGDGQLERLGDVSDAQIYVSAPGRRPGQSKCVRNARSIASSPLVENRGGSRARERATHSTSCGCSPCSAAQRRSSSIASVIFSWPT